METVLLWVWAICLFIMAACWVVTKWLKHRLGVLKAQTPLLMHGWVAISDERIAPSRYVEASGTVETEDLDAVRAWLQGVADRLTEVGIQFVTQGFIHSDGVVRWSIGASDPTSTRDELALMVGNAVEAAGAVPPA